MVTLGEEFFQQILGCQQALFKHTDFQFAGGLQLMIGIQHLLILPRRQRFEVVGLHFGNAGLHQLVHAVSQHAFYVVHRQFRKCIIHDIPGSFPEDA